MPLDGAMTVQIGEAAGGSKRASRNERITDRAQRKSAREASDGGLTSVTTLHNLKSPRASPRASRSDGIAQSPSMARTRTRDSAVLEEEEAKDSFYVPDDEPASLTSEEGSEEDEFVPNRLGERRVSKIKEKLAGLNFTAQSSTRRISLQSSVVNKKAGSLYAAKPRDSKAKRSSPRQTMHSTGSRGSQVSLDRHTIQGNVRPSKDIPNVFALGDRNKKRSTLNPLERNSGNKVRIAEFDEDNEKTKLNHGGTHRHSSTDTRPRHRWTQKGNQLVRFEPTGTSVRNEAAITGRYVDELAIERSQRDCRHKLSARDNAILHHRDSMAIGLGTSTPPDLSSLQWPLEEHKQQPREEHGGASSSTSTPRKTRRRHQTDDPSTLQPRTTALALPKMQGQWPPVQTLRRLALLESCSERFLNLLVAGCEQLQLRPGEVRDIGIRVGSKTTQAMAVVVESGSCRIEVGKVVVSECHPGSSFGLAKVLESTAPTNSRTTSGVAPVGPLADFLVRACNDTCRFIIFPCAAFKKALSACPEEKGLREVLRMINQPIDGTQHLAAYLNCCDSAKPAMTDSSTREVYAKGGHIVTEGDKSPHALLFVRSGTVALEIKGVEVRRVQKGQVIGEEMLFGICRKWAFTIRCVTMCDIQILHRHLFIASVFKMQEGNTEDKRESHRLLTLVDGTWKDDRVHLAWPLFRGYDQDLLAKLASVIETRVVLPGVKLWENVASWYETALYFLLSGTCEEISTHQMHVRSHHRDGVGQTQRAMQQVDSKSVKRNVVPGTCIGSREFLGLAHAGHVVVKAHTLCLVAVLHRIVYLRMLDNPQARGFQSSEVTRLLQEELESQEDKGAAAKADSLISELSLLRGHDKAFVEYISNRGTARRFYITGQYLCRAGEAIDTMYVTIRGDVRMFIAGIEIHQFNYGKEINALALAEADFVPSFTITCEKTSELWAVTRKAFDTCLNSFSTDRRLLEDLLQFPSILPDLFANVGSGTINDPLILDSIAEDARGVSSAPGKSPRKGTTLGERLSTLAESRNTLTASLSQSGTLCPTPGRESISVNNNVSLSQVDMFKACSTAFMTWLEEHLQAAVWFPDDPVIKEGDVDTSLYLIRAGTVVVEGSAGGGAAYESYSGGASFGEHRLLGLSEKVHMTTVAIEISVLQVLHRCVFQHALELFPDQAAHFDRVTLQKMESAHTFELSSSPFFHGSNRDFRMHVDRLMTTRLIHQGAIIVEEGEIASCLRMLKSGSALVEDADGDPLKRLTQGAVLNADAVLGTTRCAVSNIRAEKLCAVAEVETLDFLGLLQRFPQEIMPLLKVAVGQIWPSDADAVPLFRGVNSYFFQQLMDKSEWHMFLPDHCVVRQGGAGQMLFLLCYGIAVRKVEGLVVGGPLVRGECIGKANMFGISGKYSSSVFTQTVCHFRTITHQHLTRLLQDHAPEHERFESLKHQVQAELENHEQEVLAEVTREKLKRRAETAFRGHVARERQIRGFDPGDSVASLPASEVLRLVGLGPKAKKEDSGKIENSGPSEGADIDDEEDSSASSDAGGDRKKTHRSSRPNKISLSKNRSTGGTLHDLANGLKPKLNALVKKIKEHREHTDEDDHLGQIWDETGSACNSARQSLISTQAPETGQTGSPRTPRSNKNRKSRNSLLETPSPLSQGRLSPRHSGGEHWNGSDSDGSSDGEVTVPASLRRLAGGRGRPTDRSASIVRVTVTDVDSPRSTVGANPGDYSSNDSFDKEFFVTLQEMSGKSTSKSKVIDAAISEHAGARQRAMLRGRVLRLLHNGLPLDGVQRGARQLSQEDLHELSFHLPQLPTTPSTPFSGDTEGSLIPTSPGKQRQKQQREAMLCDGVPPMRILPPTHQKAMVQKYLQLTGQQFAIVPGV